MDLGGTDSAFMSLRIQSQVLSRLEWPSTCHSQCETQQLAQKQQFQSWHKNSLVLFLPDKRSLHRVCLLLLIRNISSLGLGSAFLISDKETSTLKHTTPDPNCFLEEFGRYCRRSPAALGVPMSSESRSR